MVSASARAGLVLAVPAVVGVAAAGRIVAGQLDLAARCFADSALAEGADGDVGSDGSPAGGAWNGHGLIVPRPEQGKPHPPGGRAALDAGYDLDQVLAIDDLVRGDNVFFAATGVTDGELLRGVRFRAHEVLTQSLSMRSVSGAVRLIDARHQLDRSNLVTRPRS